MVTQEDVPLKDKILGSATEAVQNFDPVNTICQYVCGIHKYDHDPNRQVIAFHYCSHEHPSLRQCAIYDSDKKDARLIGVEYIITRDVFEKLPVEEQKYWHSHNYEVMSGSLVAPRVPAMMEDKLMKELIDTYGKTWHMWQVDRGDELPLGEPKLMMSATSDGQVNEKLLKQRDDYLGIDSKKLRQHRMTAIQPVLPHPNADVGFGKKERT